MKLVIDGQEFYPEVEFVSRSIRNAYLSGVPWDSDQYRLVEIGAVFWAWITQAEEEELSKFVDFDELSEFADTLGILAIPGDDFNKWRHGKG